MKALLRASEFWVSAVTVVGGLLTTSGVVPKDLWDQTVIPALVYVLGRVGGKVAKSTIK